MAVMCVRFVGKNPQIRSGEWFHLGVLISRLEGKSTHVTLNKQESDMNQKKTIITASHTSFIRIRTKLLSLLVKRMPNLYPTLDYHGLC